MPLLPATDVPRRRACILEAADRLLRHYGPHKTTVADVAREAGVGVGTVYLEFPSKDVLVEEISRARYLAVLGRMNAAAAQGGKSASERLVGAMDARLEAFLSLSGEGAHAGDLMHCMSPAVKSAQAAFYEEELVLVTELLRAGAKATELEAGDADLAARTVLRAYATFTPPWLGGKDAEEIRRAQGAMHQLVLGGLLAREEVQRRRRAPRRGT